eukprot:15181285-Alexandrium_andersonii.AAC.1
MEDTASEGLRGARTRPAPPDGRAATEKEQPACRAARRRELRKTAPASEEGAKQKPTRLRRFWAFEQP